MYEFGKKKFGCEEIARMLPDKVNFLSDRTKKRNGAASEPPTAHRHQMWRRLGTEAEPEQRNNTEMCKIQTQFT